MTEHPNDTLCTPHFYTQLKRPLTNSSSFSDVAHCFIKGNENSNQLNDTNSQYNLQAIVDKIKRDVECTYRLHKTKKEKENSNYTAESIESTGDTSTCAHPNLRKATNSIENINNNITNNNNITIKMAKSPTETADCNSNPPMNRLAQLVGSIASSHDFTHDNSDYQWFADYGYRENNVIHQSVLSSLSASYNGIGDLSYYEDLPKLTDANLIESFRDEDVNLLLSSICKSKQLFSPVKESVLSVDSLDMDCYAEDCDMILTCQANKNNYTIAFEGSAMYSDESFYDDLTKDNQKDSKSSIDDIVKKKSLEVSFTRSEAGLTTWSKLKENSSTQLCRCPSGNNNTSVNVDLRHCLVRKSNSLPNIQAESMPSTYSSDAISSSNIESFGRAHNMLPMCSIPDSSSPSESPQPLHNSTSSNEPPPNQPSFNLVKLFIKQKSSSTDTCMDVSSGCWPSDASSSAEQRQRKKSMYDSGKGSALSKHDEDVTEAEIQYDSLDLPPIKEPENEQTDSSTASPRRTSTKSNDLYREVFDSPSHRRYKDCNLNIRNQHLANVKNNNSVERDSLKETLKSISDVSRTSENITQVYAKTNLSLDLITRSMQTSKMNESVKVVPPSFLAQLNQTSHSCEKKAAPVYVIYPNYALPDLGFVKSFHSQVFLSPLGLQESFPKKRRPMSTADVDYLKKCQYKHVADWSSLAPLLPVEYKKLLLHIPEVKNVYHDKKMSQKPMFCMSPPIRRAHQTSCDCSSYYTTSTSGSGASQPPSSGYRGSSTLLTDSELESDHRQPIDSPAELPPSGVMKRGILRRAQSTKSQTKRNSMFENASELQSIKEKRSSIQNPSFYMKAFAAIENNFLDQTKEQFSVEQKEHDEEARQRVEHFLNSVPKSELKYYAEIANILESIENLNDLYDRNQLKNEVSRALAQKHVSFSRESSEHRLYVNTKDTDNGSINSRNQRNSGLMQRPFTTPPNSPNISISAARNSLEQHQRNAKKSKQDKIQSNRFKRLQIQWELLSKDAQQMEKELFKETRSGGTTPTSAQKNIVRSKIPRPVSYPSASKTSIPVATKTTQSPSRLGTPKKTNIAPSTTPVTRPRTPNKLHNTPKKKALESNLTKPSVRVGRTK